MNTTRTRLSRNAQHFASALVSRFEVDIRGYASDAAKDAGREFANEEDIKWGYAMAVKDLADKLADGTLSGDCK
jgi:histone H3/H4